MAATSQPDVVNPLHGAKPAEEREGDAYDSFWASVDSKPAPDRDATPMPPPQRLAGKAYQEFLDR